jgi:hypothetical protein
MPGTQVDLGTGTAITFGTSGYSAEILSIAWSGISRAVVDVTPLSVTPAAPGTIGNRRYKSAIAVDPGTLECTFHFNPNLTPPVGAVEETITITFPLVSGDLTAARWQANGQMTDFNIEGIELDTKVIARCTIKLTGAITITAAT